ncbi:hypothetical protein GCM10012280_40900 [Wenjunlia tyrosinilytica]|uniref:Uncharacterized protein n=2 Tax=Wenjunlia tyrosinilytica TaxID=1544741 RepID=A0A917ZTH5_9ACTN|nr:hypothetical protein GCM10012280_40900 [Wenjunlia tyrosinilytica]
MADGPAAGTATLGPDLRILAVDSSFIRYFGRSSAELCGLNLYELLHPSSLPVLREHFLRLRDGRRSRFTQHVLARGSRDEVFPGVLTGVPVQGRSDQRSAVIVLVKPDGRVADEPPSTRHRILLSPVEARILEGVAEGTSTVQMAAKLYLSRQGVEYHVASLFRKMKAPNRAALVSRAHSVGMLTVGAWPPRVVPDYVK